MRIYYSSKFEREYRKLPKHVKTNAEQKEKLLRIDPFNATLNTDKLGGKMRGHWTFWIDQKYRIIFEFSGDEVVWFHSAGDHAIYR